MWPNSRCSSTFVRDGLGGVSVACRIRATSSFSHPLGHFSLIFDRSLLVNFSLDVFKRYKSRRRPHPNLTESDGSRWCVFAALVGWRCVRGTSVLASVVPRARFSELGPVWIESRGPPHPPRHHPAQTLVRVDAHLYQVVLGQHAEIPLRAVPGQRKRRQPRRHPPPRLRQPPHEVVPLQLQGPKFRQIGERRERRERPGEIVVVDLEV